MKTVSNLLLPKEAAELLRIKVCTLATWRTLKNRNLNFVKVGRSIRYKHDDVINFINENTQTF